MADFWNWREQFRRKWIDEIYQLAEIELIHVSPQPTQMESGIVGHVILVQHNSIEWSSILVSVFDSAINSGHPFHMAHSFPERLIFKEIIVRIGHSADCRHHAHCSFRIRDHTFQYSDQIRASDGDAVDLMINRFIRPQDWNPPFIPHHPGAEGVSLLNSVKSMGRNGKVRLLTKEWVIGFDRVSVSPLQQGCKIMSVTLMKFLSLWRLSSISPILMLPILPLVLGNPWRRH